MELGILFWTFVLILLTCCSAFFSSSEISLFSLSSMKIKAYQTDQDPRKKLISTLLTKPRDLLVTVFILNTFVNILLQNVASNAFGQYGNWTFKVGLPLFLTLVFGEIIPKNLGILNNEWISYKVAPIVMFFQKMLSPIRRLIIYITTPISKILFFYLKKGDPISKEELRHTLEASEKYGVLTSDESEYVRGYLSLQEVDVREVMRPKSDILFFDIYKPISKLIHLFKDQECTRIPVCKGSLDNLLGIITARQFFINRDKIIDSNDLISFLTQPLFVPESMPAKLLLRKFMMIQDKLALVVNEYGSLVGLITSEDIAELVIGDIQDLRDENAMYKKSGKNEIIADGKLDLAEFTDLFEVSLSNPNNFMTIGGWLLEQFDEIPKAGSKYENDQFIFHVLSADNKRINRVYIRKK